jgi:hypothetical protein
MMSDEDNKPSPGEWQEHCTLPSLETAQLYVEHLSKSKKIELYTVRNDPHEYIAWCAAINLTPDQARSVAQKLIELADFLDENTSE